MFMQASFVNANYSINGETPLDMGKKEEVKIKEDIGDIFFMDANKAEEILVDCACPRTVSGVLFVKNFLKRAGRCLNDFAIEDSQRVYRFGGGERRVSIGVVNLPCIIAGKEVYIRTELIEEDIPPLLIGNTTLKSGKMHLDFEFYYATVLGTRVNMRETSSGHWSIKIEPQKVKSKDKAWQDISCLFVSNNFDGCSPEKQTFLEAEMILLTEETQEDLTDKKLQKLHHFYGHVAVEKVAKLITRAGKMKKDVEACLKRIKDKCQACTLVNYLEGYCI